MDMRSRAFEEDRAKDIKSTVNQLMFQIQELLDKVISLNDAREFYHPETASSSGLSHVPNQPMSTPSLHGLVGRDSCSLLHGTLWVQQDILLKIYLLQLNHQKQSLEIRRIWHQCLAELYLWIQEGMRSEQVCWRETLCNTNTSICQEVFDVGSSLSCRRNFFLKLHDGVADESNCRIAFR